MTKKHNKKRNVGIIYELLLRQISNDLIENKMDAVKTATKILESNFGKHSELYKEFRLVNALTTSSVSSTETAAAILSEAKSAARRTDLEKIDKAKSKLIREINYNIKDKKFYYRHVKNYVDYANVQNLINEWRKKDDSSLKKVADLEGRTIEILLKEKAENNLDFEKRSLDASQSNKLVLKLMTEKINKKYSHLSEDQKEIIKNYALYNNQSDKEKLVTYLIEKKKNCLSALNRFEKSNDNKFVDRKINEVRKRINRLKENDLSDNSILKFMTITNLLNELTSGEK
jgi:ribosomal protein S15P/S13E